MTELDLILSGQNVYLGDGVYAHFDGYQIWLETQEGMRIALEPAVFKALREFADKFGGYFK